jgi:splicing factor U2AF 65 kDa subunit
MGKHKSVMGNPILSCWISQDGHFAFLEFRTVADVTEGFALGQISLMGQPIKVGRTKN